MTDGRPLIEVLNFRHWCRSQVRPRWELGGWENEFSLRSVTVSGSGVGRRRRSRPACRVAEPGSCDDFTVNLIVLCVSDSPLRSSGHVSGHVSAWCLRAAHLACWCTCPPSRSAYAWAPQSCGKSLTENSSKSPTENSSVSEIYRVARLTIL